MSDQVFEQHVDEHGNVFVRISQDVVVLTREEADRLMARFDQLKSENARLREQIHWLKQGDILHVLTDQEYIDQCERERLMQVSIDALDKDNAKLRESLERAAGIIADICGECPVSRYEWLSNDGCAEKCGSVTEDECWIAYLTGKRWDESGTEVDR